MLPQPWATRIWLRPLSVLQNPRQPATILRQTQSALLTNRQRSGVIPWSGAPRFAGETPWFGETRWSGAIPWCGATPSFGAIAKAVSKISNSTARQFLEGGSAVSRTAKAYITLVIVSGTLILLLAAGSWSSTNLKQFIIFLGLAALASTLKVRIPGIEGTMSPN